MPTVSEVLLQFAIFAILFSVAELLSKLKEDMTTFLFMCSNTCNVALESKSPMCLALHYILVLTFINHCQARNSGNVLERSESNLGTLIPNMEAVFRYLAWRE